MKFSVIIPVYNRPEEVDELLQSLVSQSFGDFEVIIVEDGSDIPCGEVVEMYRSELDLHYFMTENSGPAAARNFGAKQAATDLFVFFDSDCIIPPDYFKIVESKLEQNGYDCYGGPDRSAPTFSGIQKAISYTMTSFLTTGGIRGKKKRMDTFYPRSFNMGISRNAFESVGGFADLRFGEDVDLSLRLEKAGFRLGLIPNAYVYHKRRTSFRSFYKQVFNSGMARITLANRHPGTLKFVHILPLLFTLYVFLSLVTTIHYPWFWGPVLLFCLAVFVDAIRSEGETGAALLAVPAAFIQLVGYGAGFGTAVIKKLLLKDEKLSAFDETFYE